MSFVNALGLVLAVIGGILTFLALGPFLGHAYFIWAVFIATATGVAIGGTTEAFKNLVICGIAGCLLAWIATLIIINVPVAASIGLPAWAGIVVGLTTGCLAWIANVPLFPAIPATVVGYAMTFAYLLSGDFTPGGHVSNKVLLGATLENPIICIPVSLIVAAGFGIVSLKLATMLSTKSAANAPAPAE